MKTDFYKVLGLKKGADQKEIKKAYHRLAKKYHPDTNQGDKASEQKFKEVSEAYDVLSDPEKKKLYDTYGMAAFDESGGSANYSSGSGAGAGFGGFGGFSGAGAGYGGFGGFSGFGSGEGFGGFGTGDGRNYREFRTGDGRSYREFRTGNSRGFSTDGGNWDFSSFGDDDFLRSLFGNNSGGRQSLDVKADLTISFEEAALGCTKTIRVDGIDSPSLQVHIPAGIDEGQTVRLKGKGRTASQGARGTQSSGSGSSAAQATGDLLLRIHIAESHLYERKGTDIYTTAEIPYTTAVLGGKATVHTLYGNVECRIPAGTQCGSKIRLKNKGIVSRKNPGQYGDEYITVKIAVPKVLTPEERKHIEALAAVHAQTKSM